MIHPSLAKFISVAIAVLTFVGIALHDTKLDSMTTFAIALPVGALTFEVAQVAFGGDAHTHVERVTLDTLAGRYTAQLPKLRHDDDRKYRLGRGVTKSGHPFEGYLLPMT